jgi:serine/threonine protein kinase
MISCLAEQHDKGIIQKDANPGNFLLYQDTIYSLDGDHVQDFGSSISKKKGLRNLAVFCTKLSTICYLDPEVCYNEYARERNLAISKKDIEYFWSKIRLYTMQIRLRRILKILRRKVKLLD